MKTYEFDGITYEVRNESEVFLGDLMIGHFTRTYPASHKSVPHDNSFNFYGFYVYSSPRFPIKTEEVLSDAYVHTADDAVEFIVKRHIKSLAAQTLGKIGGVSKSEAKISAARENGKKGGRPKKI